MADDWWDSERTAELGMAMKADWIVFGEIGGFDSDTLVTVQFYDVHAMRLAGGTYVGYPSADDPLGHVGPLVGSLMETVAASPSVPAERTYAVGDTGPAGGTVFYDKGLVDDGWRYMEAAPPGSVFRAKWSMDKHGVEGTDTAIGSGRRNTRLIAEHLDGRGESECAAQICVAMEVNGFGDWFMPSKDELELMYNVLHLGGLGGFNARGFYHTSSERTNEKSWQLDVRGGNWESATSKTNPMNVRAARVF